MNRQTMLLSGLSCLSLGVAATAGAETILLDFGFNTVDASAPYATQVAQDDDNVFWNTTMWNDTDRPFDRTDVVNTAGVATDVDVTRLTGIYNSGGQNAGYTPNPALGLLAQERVINDFISDGTSFSFSLGDLADGIEYTITIYGSRQFGNRTTNYTVTGSGAPLTDEQQSSLSDASTGFVDVPNGDLTGTAFDFVDLSVFTLTPDVNGEITILAEEGEGGFAYINAVQIDYVIPEPSALALFGAGGLLMLKRRR